MVWVFEKTVLQVLGIYDMMDLMESIENKVKIEGGKVKVKTVSKSFMLVLLLLIAVMILGSCGNGVSDANEANALEIVDVYTPSTIIVDDVDRDNIDEVTYDLIQRIWDANVVFRNDITYGEVFYWIFFNHQWSRGSRLIGFTFTGDFLYGDSEIVTMEVRFTFNQYRDFDDVEFAGAFVDGERDDGFFFGIVDHVREMINQ